MPWDMGLCKVAIAKLGKKTQKWHDRIFKMRNGLWCSVHVFNLPITLLPFIILLLFTGSLASPSHHEVVDVHLTFRDGKVSPQYKYWTDAPEGHGGWVGVKHKNELEQFQILSNTSRIFLLGVDESRSLVRFHVVHLQACHLGGPVRKEINPNEKVSELVVKVAQTGDGLSGVKVLFHLGVEASKFHSIIAHHGVLKFDVPDGVLITWSVETNQNQKYLPLTSTFSHSVTPFKLEQELVKSVDIKIHTCLDDEQGGVVDVHLEYDTASQSDTRQIIPVDHLGNLLLKNVPSPTPGEKLRITLTSKIANQQVAQLTDELTFSEDSYHISFCHENVFLSLHVHKGGHLTTPAIGALVEHQLSSRQEVKLLPVDEFGAATVMSSTVAPLVAKIPYQSTCGGHGHFSSHKDVYGVATLKDIGDKVHHEITLPRIPQVEFELNLHGIYPDEALLATDMIEGRKTMDLQDRIRGDKVEFGVDMGTKTAHLLTLEKYNSEVTMTPLNPCLAVDETTLDYNDNRIKVKQSIYDYTVLTVVKAVDQDHKPCRNVSLDFLLGQTDFGLNSMDVNEESEVIFRTPPGTLVTFKPKSRYTPNPGNPRAFIAKDQLEVVLIFDTTREQKIRATLRGDDFAVQEGTLVRFVALDEDGDELNHGDLLTNKMGRIEFRSSYRVSCLEFSVQGSDGFEPVFYQPFTYIYNVTKRHHKSPLDIDIPIRTRKNVIVMIRDAFTGQSIMKAQVKVPHDATVRHSVYDTAHMTDRHAAFSNEQGMAFFHLASNMLNIAMTITANGYEDFHREININNSETYLIEANLCRNEPHFQLQDDQLHFPRDSNVHNGKQTVDVYGLSDMTSVHYTTNVDIHSKMARESQDMDGSKIWQFEVPSGAQIAHLLGTDEQSAVKLAQINLLPTRRRYHYSPFANAIEFQVSLHHHHGDVKLVYQLGHGFTKEISPNKRRPVMFFLPKGQLIAISASGTGCQNKTSIIELNEERAKHGLHLYC